MGDVPMIRIRTSLCFVAALAALACGAPEITRNPANAPYRDPALSVERRTADLLSRMTLEEKFWQMFMIPGDLSLGKDKLKHGIFGLQIATAASAPGDSGQMLRYATSGSARDAAVRINEIQRFFVEETRLGIPAVFFDETLHGLVRDGATAFPQSVGLAATWDTDLMGRVAAAIAREVRSRGIRQALSPMLEVVRDVRWGRVEEVYGEDPFLAARMGVAYVKAYERMGVAATPKVVIANAGDGGRDSYPVHASERLLEEVFFPPFKAAVLEGGATSIMTAYNSLDGTPCTANPWLLKTIVKGRWGFDGFVISDASAVGGLLDLHHTVADREGSAESAIEAGLDVIFQTDYDHHVPLLKAVLDGRVDRRSIDEAVARVLRAKFKMGLFEQPYADPAEAEMWNGHPDHRALALEAARKSIVLLKNEGRALPLAKTIRSLAVIGTDAVEARLGGYSGPGLRKVGILDGLKEKAGTAVRVSYAPGCGRNASPYVTVPAEALRTPDGRPGLKAEYFNSIDLSGPPALTRVDPKLDFWWTLFSPHPSVNADWFSVRWTGRLVAPVTGVYRVGVEADDGFRLFLDGRPVVDNWRKEGFRAMTAPIRLEKGREQDLRVEFFEGLGNVKFRLVWDVGAADPGPRIEEAVRLARGSEAAVVVAGIEEGEFRDRADIGLPGAQAEMIRRVAATGVPTVVVLVGGSAVTMSDWIDLVPAVVEAWYPGEAGGQAVADVLFGDENPGGRLPVTFPRSVAQLPLYYNHLPTGRGDDYLDMTGKPLFPFGHGLSYTEFAYDGLEISPAEIRPDGRAAVRFRVRNAGATAGDEVVQMYVRDLTSSLARPVMELKGFRRIHLALGESRKVELELGPAELSMLDAGLKRVVEPGDFKVMIGRSSRDIRMRGFLKVVR
jgi:beta-glucosidase